MSKILVLNSGSSSLKYRLFDYSDTASRLLAKGLAERIGLDGANVSYQASGQDKQQVFIALPDHEAALGQIFRFLLDNGLSSLNELAAVGHRLGHGGEYFRDSVVITDDNLPQISSAQELLPLHGKAFMLGIAAVKKLLPALPQVAVFDTSFHQTMPQEAYLYALPFEQYSKYHIRRYGFHGTSHRFVSAELTKLQPSARKVISCHLGSGGSITAIKDGKSVDTSLGFTGTAGIVMGTRCGDIDAFIPLYIMQTQNKTAHEVHMMMNKESGLFGLSGGHSDRREVEALYLKGDPQAKAAYEVYVHSIIKYIGAYAAVMNGVDAVIFTAGIGENSSLLRQIVCERLAYLGIELDLAANTAVNGQSAEISVPSSRVKVWVIPTDEEKVIADDTYRLAVKPAN
ncbi:MAG: acetate kinase [Alphaproteobacteria bacterium]|nr:acetate kinase [Alphaproteobacteria bacterium]